MSLKIQFELCICEKLVSFRCKQAYISVKVECISSIFSIQNLRDRVTLSGRMRNHPEEAERQNEEVAALVTTQSAKT